MQWLKTTIYIHLIQKLQQYLYYTVPSNQKLLVHHNNSRFKADKSMMTDALVHLRKKRGAGGRGEANAGESVLATVLWGTLFADDAGVVSQSPDRVAEEDDGGDRGGMRGV